MSKQYSDVMSYLEDTDNDMAQVIKDCCVEYLFNPRNKPGITLLLPDKKTNAAIRNQLIENSSSIEVEDKMQAARQLAALVIFDNLSSPDVFKSHADHIPNGLNQHVPIDLVKSTSNTIKFKSGCTAELDQRFKEQCSKKNFNIYILSNGAIGCDNPPINKNGSNGNVTAGNRRKKTEDVPAAPKMWSDDDDNDGENVALRNKITKETENLYMSEMIQRSNRYRGKSKYIQRDIYAEKVISLIGFILNCCSESAVNEILIGKILPLLSFDHIDFYIFVEPFSTGPYLIPSDIIRRWNNYVETIDYERTLANIEKLYRKCASMPGMANRYKLQEAIDDLRSEITSTSDQRKLAEIINNTYSGALNDNKIGALGHLFTDQLYNMYKKNPFRKICQDEIRYLSHRLFESLEREQFDKDQYTLILEQIERYLSPDVTSKTLRLLNPTTLKHAIQPQDKILEIQSFINSKFFLYSPMSNEEMAEFERNFEVKRFPCIEGEGIWYPDDKRKIVIASVNARASMSESAGFISEEERAINTLKQLKASGKKIDPTALSFLND